MEALFLPLLCVAPVLFFVGLYRLWQLKTQKIIFKNKIVRCVYGFTLLCVVFGFLYYGWYYYQCVWIHQCGEGFASGYIVAGVLLGIMTMSVIYMITEVFLFVARKHSH